MMRLLRISFTTFTMLLSAVIVGEWIRSYWKSDQLSLIRRDGSLNLIAVQQGKIVFHHHDQPSGQKPLKPKLFESQDIALANPPRPFGHGKGWGPFQFNRIDSAGVMAADRREDAVKHFSIHRTGLRRESGNYRFDPETRQEVLIAGAPSKLSAQQRDELAHAEARLAFFLAQPSNDNAVYFYAPHWRTIFPIWSVLIVVSVPSIWAGALTVRKRRRRSHGLCGVCAYDLTGNQSGVCPECGTAVPGQARPT
ncbi:MAG TPA: hypothetical protein VH370_24525 [Humisphaera sp.]|nr:hypothetical protein [Humisphaera sp.]